MPLVEYIGRKPKQTDTVAGTGTIWVGTGDVQPVSDEAWAAMAKHPFVWRLAEKQQVPAVTGGLSDAASLSSDDSDKPADKPDLYAMNTAALRDYATAKGYDVDLTLKGSALRAAIVAIETASA
jgi:hypothetical protein